MKGQKNIIKTVVFTVFGVGLFLIVQSILFPKEQENYRDAFYTIGKMDNDVYEVLF